VHRDVVRQEQNLGEDQLAELREHRHPQLRQERQAAGARERTGKGEVVERLVEGDRRIEGQDDQRCHCEDQPGCDPQPLPPDALPDLLPDAEPRPMDSHHHGDQDALRQDAEKTKKETKLTENRQTQSDRHPEPFPGVFLIRGVEPAGDQPPRHPEGRRQEEERQQMKEGERDR
jgi:hypothetical protein